MVSRLVYLGVGAPSLMRGWVCNLLVQLLLDLARAITRVQSRRTRDHILLSHLKLPQPGGPGPRIYIPHEQGGRVISPCRGGLEYLPRSDASRKRRRKGNPVPGGITVIKSKSGYIMTDSQSSFLKLLS
jgi:hypothetical protein